MAITEICVSVISKDIAGKLNDLLRNAQLIIRDPPKVVEWRETNDFTVTSAGLNESLFIIGQLNETIRLHRLFLRCCSSRVWIRKIPPDEEKYLKRETARG